MATFSDLEHFYDALEVASKNLKKAERKFMLADNKYGAGDVKIQKARMARDVAEKEYSAIMKEIANFCSK